MKGSFYRDKATLIKSKPYQSTKGFIPDPVKKPQKDPVSLMRTRYRHNYVWCMISVYNSGTIETVKELIHVKHVRRSFYDLDEYILEGKTVKGLEREVRFNQKYSMPVLLTNQDMEKMRLNNIQKTKFKL